MLDANRIELLESVELLQSEVQRQAHIDVWQLINSQPLSDSGWCFKERKYEYIPSHNLCHLYTYKDAIESHGKNSFQLKSWVEKEKDDAGKCHLAAHRVTSCITF
jgi:hypothetical protein